MVNEGKENMKFFIVSIIVILSQHAIAQTEFTCVPAVDCTVRGAGALVPDPASCQNYYICIELADGSVVPSSIPINCGQGNYFDQVYQTCMPETDGVCINLCENGCPWKCPEPFPGINFVANKDNCTTYFTCGPAGPVLTHCVAPNLYFDGSSCVADPADCCSFCQPYCEKAGIQIQDPCDCLAFYVCLGQGEASEENRGSCSPGTYYDEATAQCVVGTCSNFCSAGQCNV